MVGPAGFLALKALAFRGRGANKDAYDIEYTLRHYPGGPRAIAATYDGLLPDDDASKALEVLREDFTHESSLGPMRAAAFVGRERDAEFLADVVSFVLELLDAIDDDRTLAGAMLVRDAGTMG